jgi:hypothetical protein
LAERLDIRIHNFLYSLQAKGKVGYQIQSELYRLFRLTYSMKYGERRDAYRVLTGKPQGKWQLGRARCK